MTKDFMFCHQKQCRTIDLYVFNLLCDFFTIIGAMFEYTVCTDGAAFLNGKHLGVVARIKEKVPNSVQAKRIIHWKLLVAKHFGKSSSEDLYFCAIIVNIRVVESEKFFPFHPKT